MRKRIIIVVVLIIGAAAAVAVYSRLSQPVASDKFAASGTIEAVEVDLGTQIGGTLTETNVSEGDKIKKNELVAKFDDTILKSRLTQAQAGLDAAKAAATQSADASSASPAAADAAIKQAEAGVDIAKTQLGFASIYSPINGQVLSVPYVAGENPAPGSTVAVLADLDNLNVTVYVPEGDLGKIKIGRKARISVDSIDRKFTGHITHVAEEAEFTPTNIETKDQRVKQVFAVTIKVKNVNGLLKPGMPADVNFKI